MIIEGGAKTLQAFIDAGLWAEARIFTGTKTLDKGIPAPKLNKLIAETYKAGDDRLEIIYNRTQN